MPPFLAKRGLLRRSVVHIILVLSLLPLLASAASDAQHTTPKKPWFFGQAGYVQAVSLQSVSGAAILLYFTADWCQRCKQMKKVEFADPQLLSYLTTELIAVEIKPENSSFESKLAAEFKVRKYPTMWIVRADNSQTLVDLPFRHGADRLIHAFKQAVGRAQ